MSMPHFLANGHGGLYYDSTESDPKALTLPKNVYVVFYLPPGRSFGAAAAKQVASDIESNKGGLRNSIEDLKTYLIGLNAMLKVKNKNLGQLAGVKPKAGVEEFRFGQGWPRVVDGKENHATYLFDYQLSGPKEAEKAAIQKDDLFFGYKLITNKTLTKSLSSYTDNITMSDLLRNAKTVAEEKGSCVIHWLACRAHFDLGEVGGELFGGAEDVIVQKICLKQGARDGIK